MSNTKRTKVIYARKEKACDALGNVESVGMAIYDSQKKLLGYLPYQTFRVEKIRHIEVSGFSGKALVKILPQLKRR